MHVRSLADQRVSIGPDFQRGPRVWRKRETIEPNAGYKFRRGDNHQARRAYRVLPGAMDQSG
jgi:hypothetical protein